MSIPDLMSSSYQRLPHSLQRRLREAFYTNLIQLLSLGFRDNVFFEDVGWFVSNRRGAPVNGDGKPIPWYTYSIIDFLQSRLTDEHHVFEYGGGHSTIWYANQADRVVSVEHSERWAEIITPEIPDNGTVIPESDPETYIAKPKDHGPFDIVVIDGQNRPQCVKPALDSLSRDGVVILDDYKLLTEDDDYRYDPSEFSALLDSEFNLLPFYGTKPLATGKRCTALFYRDNNCLGV